MIYFRASSSKRFAAFLLIVSICLCLGVEDLLLPEACGEDRSEPLTQERSLVLGAAEGTQQGYPAASGDEDHDCLCCCHHLITSGSFLPIHILNRSILVPIFGEVVTSVTSQALYHPPRS